LRAAARRVGASAAPRRHGAGKSPGRTRIDASTRDEADRDAAHRRFATLRARPNNKLPARLSATPAPSG
jgi:hypothetical protein